MRKLEPTLAIMAIVGAVSLAIVYISPKGQTAAKPLESVQAQAKACGDLNRAIAVMYRESAAEDWLVELEKGAKP